MAIPVRLRKQVILRAQGRCEYCGLSQLGQAATFHVDHVVPQAANGETELSNLALACIHCSLRKGARQTASDPKTGKETPLFHPRTDRWNHHFRWNKNKITGITSIGRTTIVALALNSTEHQVIRSFELLLSRHPPPGHL